MRVGQNNNSVNFKAKLITKGTHFSKRTNAVLKQEAAAINNLGTIRYEVQRHDGKFYRTLMTKSNDEKKASYESAKIDQPNSYNFLRAKLAEFAQSNTKKNEAK